MDEGTTMIFPQGQYDNVVALATAAKLFAQAAACLGNNEELVKAANYCATEATRPKTINAPKT